MLSRNLLWAGILVVTSIPGLATVSFANPIWKQLNSGAMVAASCQAEADADKRLQSLLIAASQKVKREDFRGAIRDLDRAIAINANVAYLYILRGATKERIHADRSAIADFDRAIAIDPNSAYAYLGRGSIWQKLQEYRQALTDFDRAIQIDPKLNFAYRSRAYLKAFQLQDLAGAASDYDRAIAISPNDGQLYLERAYFKEEKLKEYRQALFDYNRAIELDAKLAIAYLNRGLLLHHTLQENFTGALNDYNRGNLKYQHLNDKAGGIVDLQTAAKLFKQRGDLDNYQYTVDYIKQLVGNDQALVVPRILAGIPTAKVAQ